MVRFSSGKQAGKPLLKKKAAAVMIGDMKFVIQVVSEAAVSVAEESAQPHREQGSIGTGYAVLVGIGEGDTEETADRMIDKLLALRIFPDENGKTNLSLGDAGGALLLISQFTLYADCRKGNRPSFTHAAAPDCAEALYHYIVERCRARVAQVEEGVFGAHMRLTLTNEGPFTILLDSEELSRPRREHQDIR